jgi:hypothetical protein
MTRYDHTIELPIDDAEAVKCLQRELRAAKQRLAESRHHAEFSVFRRQPLPGSNVSGRP